jgi:hypothetical protein
VVLPRQANHFRVLVATRNVGYALATEASRSDVNVAMPHLRGKWSPTNAILRTLEVLFMRHSIAAMCRFDTPASPGAS